MSEAPRVTISPLEGSGVPMIRNKQTHLIAESYLAGYDEILKHLQLSRYELIVGCWFEARYGTQQVIMKAWALWATYIEVELRRGDIEVDDLPLPPRVLRPEPGE